MKVLLLLYIDNTVSLKVHNTCIKFLFANIASYQSKFYVIAEMIILFYRLEWLKWWNNVEIKIFTLVNRNSIEWTKSF